VANFDFQIFFSTKAMMIFTVLIIVISLAATFFIRPNRYENTRFYVFMSVLASVSALLVGLSLGISSLAFEEQQDINRVTFTEEAVAKLWARPNELIVTSKNARDEFVKSLYYNNVDLYNVPLEKEPESRLSILEEQHIAMVLIQAWEDFLTLRHLIITDDLPWFCTFIQWAQSPYLKKYFFTLKNIFKDTTIGLGEVLFEYAKRLPVPTADPSAYPTLVSEMLKDPKLIKIFETHPKKKLRLE